MIDRHLRSLTELGLRNVPGLGPVRDRVGMAVTNLLTDGAGRPEVVDSADIAYPGDPGLFGPDSVTWRVHSDLAMFVGGVRSLLVQSLHPLAMTGVARHSAFRDDPLGRLARTGAYVGVTTFGAVPEAEQMIAAVRAVHERVRGVADDGRPYSANDPALLAWVHNVEVESFLVAYRRYGSAPLTDVDADRYVAEMTEVLRRFGVDDASLMPCTAGDLTRWIRTHPEQARIPETTEAVRFLMLPPLPVTALPSYGVIAAAAVGLVPVRQRRLLGLAAPVPFSSSGSRHGVLGDVERVVAGGVDRAAATSASVFDAVVVRPAVQSLMGVMGWALGSESPALAAANRRVAAGDYRP
ncbi:MAG: oxygenase MpaB family protein [Actinomycetes bacterium]